jgi:hypothetical protein
VRCKLRLNIQLNIEDKTQGITRCTRSVNEIHFQFVPIKKEIPDKGGSGVAREYHDVHVVSGLRNVSLKYGCETRFWRTWMEPPMTLELTFTQRWWSKRSNFSPRNFPRYCWKQRSNKYSEPQRRKWKPGTSQYQNWRFGRWKFTLGQTDPWNSVVHYHPTAYEKSIYNPLNVLTKYAFTPNLWQQEEAKHKTVSVFAQLSQWMTVFKDAQ